MPQRIVGDGNTRAVGAMHEGLSHIGMAALDALAALAAQFLHTGSEKHQELGATKTWLELWHGR